jgi:23S rRNA (guanosine2251-2'-O)-methyltransferase
LHIRTVSEERNNRTPQGKGYYTQSSAIKQLPMQGFPLTQKRLLSMPQARQHKWIKKWLEGIYYNILNGQTDLSTLPGLMKQYQLIASWIGIQHSSENIDKNSKKSWLECISNLVHIHQQKTNIGRHENDFLPNVRVGDITSTAVWTPKCNYGVALDNIRSAFNVGSIFRTTDGAGLAFLILGGHTPGKENLQVKKTSMKTTDWIPGIHAAALKDSLTEYRQKGYPIIGIETTENAKPYHLFQWPEKAIIVFGNEEYGISNEVLLLCDEFVHIPMFGFKNSINIANAYAVIAFNIAAQFN